VHPSAVEAPSPPEVIAKAYQLTMTELRVLLAIVDVGGVPEVAKVLGIAATTVKTHLGHVFEKTGTKRQADLVKLVAGFSNPLMK
jgi:DNA-binding CsgD family transcriptional regulator